MKVEGITKKEGLTFLKRPLPIDNFEFLILAEILFGGNRILEKMSSFVLSKKEQLKRDGYMSLDCDACQKSQFLMRAIGKKNFLLSRNSCLIRGVLKLSEIIEFTEEEGIAVY